MHWGGRCTKCIAPLQHIVYLQARLELLWNSSFNQLGPVTQWAGLDAQQLNINLCTNRQNTDQMGNQRMMSTAHRVLDAG